MAALIALAACSTSRTPAESSDQQTRHSLVGKIWVSATGRFTDERGLIKKLAAADHVLLGERHDNRTHHDNQAWIIKELLTFARRPVVAMEMLTPDDDEIVASYVAGDPLDGSGLGAALGWSARGWPAWDNYQPIADIAVHNGLRLASAALSEREAETLRAGRKDADTEWLLKRLGIDKPLDQQQYDAIADDIRDAHCGYAPSSIIPSMVLVQRARDARMAATLARVDTGRGTVLIAGSGHVRNDRAVPFHLRSRDRNSPVASLAFVEVDAGRRRPREYATAFKTEKLPFDFVWFTEAVERADPCEEFRAVLEGLGNDSE